MATGETLVVEPSVGAVSMVTPGADTSTVTLTVAELPVLPAPSACEATNE